MKTIARQRESDRYFALVREFPLRPLRTAHDLAAANRTALRLVTAKPEEEMDSGERDYLDALAVLIQDAETTLLETMAKKVIPVELLRHLMEERHMTVSDLGRVIGSQPAASLILAKKRDISKPQIQKLAAYFGLSPAAFLN